MNNIGNVIQEKGRKQLIDKRERADRGISKASMD